MLDQTSKLMSKKPPINLKRLKKINFLMNLTMTLSMRRNIENYKRESLENKKKIKFFSIRDIFKRWKMLKSRNLRRRKLKSRKREKKKGS